MRRAEAARAVLLLLDQAPKRVVFGHGARFRRDGAARAQRALTWLIGATAAQLARILPELHNPPSHLRIS